MRDLPSWAVYIISGLAAMVLILSGVSGTLLINDRQVVAKSIEKLDLIIEVQNKQIKIIETHQEKSFSELAKHNERQNHVMEKICVALSMNHKTRMETFKNYPLMVR
jgi:hypothetical protein